MLTTMQRTSKRSVKPTQARAELAKRKLAQRDFFQFCQYVDPRFQPYAHQEFLADKLMQVKRYIETNCKEGIGRLMIMMPPQHGKSELASIKFPAWLLGCLPDVRIILTSYGADLASRNSRAMRDLVNSSRYQAIFGLKSSNDEPVMLSSDSRSSTNWDLAQPHNGGVLASGVGGAITGFGAGLMVIDDPFKNREEAESEGRRDLVDDWYKSSALTRLSPAGAVILFHTRWHMDDQAGRLIKRMAIEPRADQWEIICLPALAFDDYPDEANQKKMMADGVYVPLADPLGRKAGEALLPEKYNAEWLENKRVNVGIYDFEAMYQQNPFLRSGEFFKREWFTIVENPPKPEDIVQRVRLWDKAGTRTGIGGDFAVGVRQALTKQGMIFVEHVVRRRCTPMQRDKMMMETAQQDKQLAGPAVQIHHQQDPGSAGLDSAQATNRMFAAEGFRARFHTLTGDKEVRAGPWSSACQGGQVFLVRAGWNQDFIEEHVAFPKGRYDDQVDTASDAYIQITARAAKKEAKSYQG